MGIFKIVHKSEWNKMSTLERAFYDYKSEYSTFEFIGDQLVQIKPNFTSIRLWIEKDCNGEVVAIISIHGNSPINSYYHGEMVTLCFEEETDAAAFKLRWM